MDAEATHRATYAAIDTIVRRKGISRSQLSLMAGLDAGSLNRSKERAGSRGMRFLTTGSIAAILDAVGMSWIEWSLLVESEGRIDLDSDEVHEIVSKALIRAAGARSGIYRQSFVRASCPPG